MSRFHGIWLNSIKKLNVLFFLREWGRQDNQKALLRSQLYRYPQQPDKEMWESTEGQEQIKYKGK